MSGFARFVTRSAGEGRLVVQPRMGFADIATMRSGLAAVAGVEGAAGTLTIDAYTRVNQDAHARRALAAGEALNGYPITVHGPEATRTMLAGLAGPTFPVQVRHGAAFPQPIFGAAIASDLDASEGGPVSYNLPYSRALLSATIAAWREAARLWAAAAERTGTLYHIESFGGCMLGQLCPPSLLVALAVLECLFFAACGIPSVSLSLAQGPSRAQDIGGLLALTRIAERRLGDVDRHVVFYTFMGLFPETAAGAERLIRDSAEIARIAGVARLIVKTAAEARGIPTIAENVTALNWARESADAIAELPGTDALDWADRIETEAERLIETTLRQSDDVGEALGRAFAAGLLDVPFCPHPANRNRTRASVDPETGAVIWSSVGDMPLEPPAGNAARLDAATFHRTLEVVRQRYDAPAADRQTENPTP